MCTISFWFIVDACHNGRKMVFHTNKWANVQNIHTYIAIRTMSYQSNLRRTFQLFILIYCLPQQKHLEKYRKPLQKLVEQKNKILKFIPGKKATFFNIL